MIKKLNKKKNHIISKKGFTLVELLGVIILLGVIATIIAPNILKTQKKSEKELFEDSVNALIRGAQMYYANNDFINYPASGIAANSQELDVKNNEDMTTGSIKLVNDEYFYASNVSNGKYCANGIRNDLSIDEGKCPDTPDRCFEFDKSTGTIKKFNKDKVGCDISNPTVPEKIDGVSVKKIGHYAFANNINVKCSKYDYEAKKYDYKYVDTRKIEDINKISEYKNDGYSCNPYYYDLDSGEQYNKNDTNPLYSVMLPSTIEAIEEGAFVYNRITTMDFGSLSNLEYIGEYAFEKNELRNVDFSKNKLLYEIDYEAFSTNNIESVNFNGAEKLEKIHDWAFEVNHITSLSLKDLQYFKDIGNGAFYHNDIGTLEFKNLPSLNIIGGYSLSNNNLTNIEIKDFPNLKVIDSGAFSDNNLSMMTIENLPKLEKISSMLANGNSITTLTLKDLPLVTTIGNSAFAENSINTLNISNVSNVETLEPRVFFRNSIPEFDLSIFPKVKTIGFNFMSHCNGAGCMTKLKIDNPLLESIDEYAFGQNGNLKTVEMGENPSLTTYAQGVFLRSPVEDIVIPKNMKNIGYRVFVRENGVKAKSVTVYGDDPLRFNSQWQQIGLINFGNNNCPVIPEGQNSVTCS